MKSLFVHRTTLAMMLMAGSCTIISCGLTQRDITAIAQTSLTTALTSALQGLLTGALAAGGAS